MTRPNNLVYILFNCLLMLALAACDDSQATPIEDAGRDASGGRVDAAADASLGQDRGAALDSAAAPDRANAPDGAVPLDAAVRLDTSAADGETPDQGEPQSDAAVADSAAVDANFVDPYAGRPLGQCNVSADCPDNAGGSGSCNADSPGGLCRMCGNDTHCPGSTECNAYGVCSQPCAAGSGEAQCPPGMTCASNGLCKILRCVDGACPVPLYTCSNSGLCRRTTCGEAGSCPDGTICVQAVCVERRQAGI